MSPPDRRFLAGWGLPVGSVLLGVLALYLYPPFLGVVPGVTVAVAASLGGLVTALSSRSAPQRVVGSIACLALPASIAVLALRPLWLDDLLFRPWARLLYALSPS